MPRDNIYPYALTTLQRVKDRIFDTAAQITFTANLHTTTTIDSITFPTNSTPPGLSVGQAVFGTGIPYGAYITVIGSNSLTLSLPATQTANGVAITVLNQPTAFDNLLVRMINGMTDWIERECGGRRFVQTLWQNEVYSAYGAKQRYLVAKKCPITYITQTGTFTVNSAVVTGIGSTAGMQPGMPIINCIEMPVGQLNYIKTVDSATQITLTAAANASATDVFQINGLVSFQWRAGTPNAPSWTSFVPDQYELVEDGTAGIIRLYGVMPRLYNNMARITYWAGYPINWANAGDGNTHTLPSDLTAACENTVVRAFKRRDMAGKLSEGLDGATTSWDKDIDSLDKDSLSHYKMIPALF